MNRRSFLSLALKASAALPLLALAPAAAHANPPVKKRRPVHRRRVVRRTRTRRRISGRPTPRQRQLARLLAASTIVLNVPAYGARPVIWRRFEGREVLVVPESIREGWWVAFDDRRFTVQRIWHDWVQGDLRRYMTLQTTSGYQADVEILKEDDPEERRDLKPIKIQLSPSGGQ